METSVGIWCELGLLGGEMGGAQDHETGQRDCGLSMSSEEHLYLSLLCQDQCHSLSPRPAGCGAHKEVRAVLGEGDAKEMSSRL